MKKTQSLLQTARIEEESMMEEKLMPMSENVIIKDPNLFERIRRQTMPIQQGFERGVSSFNRGWLG